VIPDRSLHAQRVASGLSGGFNEHLRPLGSSDLLALSVDSAEHVNVLQMPAMQKSNDDRICCLANVPLLIVDNDSNQESDGE
jgi:hypothetical protein